MPWAGLVYTCEWWGSCWCWSTGRKRKCHGTHQQHGAKSQYPGTHPKRAAWWDEPLHQCHWGAGSKAAARDSAGAGLSAEDWALRIHHQQPDDFTVTARGQDAWDRGAPSQSESGQAWRHSFVENSQLQSGACHDGALLLFCGVTSSTIRPEVTLSGWQDVIDNKLLNWSEDCHPSVFFKQSCRCWQFNLVCTQLQVRGKNKCEQHSCDWESSVNNIAVIERE